MAGQVIIVMGPPGAGKGTQSQILAEALGAVHLSSGQLLRDSGEVKILERIASGHLAASGDVERVVEVAIMAVPIEKPIVLDGFTRMLTEARWLERRLRELGRPITKVIYIQVDRSEVIKRLRQRGRSDDGFEAVEKRWKAYEAETLPVLNFYRANRLLTEIDGIGSVETVAKRVEEALV